MEDEDIAPNTYSWSSRYGQKVAPVLNIHIFQYNVQAVSAECIWRNLRVFHFAGSSIHNLFIYEGEYACLYGFKLYLNCAYELPFHFLVKIIEKHSPALQL